MNVHILVVDDEEEIRNMLSRHFRFIGFDIDTASNGREALEIMEKTKIDIVISDVMMPIMNGIDLLRSIKTQYPMTHIIMITGYVTLENALACMRHGADTLIFKPINELGLLETAVKKAVESIQHWLNLLTELQKMKPEQKGGN